MKKCMAWLGVLVIFLSGMVIGGVGTGLVIRHRVVEIFEGGPMAVRKIMLKRMARELKLTAQQRPHVEEIVAETHDELIALRERSQPEMEHIIDRGVERLKEILDAEQTLKLEAWYRKGRRPWGRGSGSVSRPGGQTP